MRYIIWKQSVKINFQIHVFSFWGCSVVLWSQCKTLKLFEPHIKYSVVLLWKCSFSRKSAQCIKSCYSVSYGGFKMPYQQQIDKEIMWKTIHIAICISF